MKEQINQMSMKKSFFFYEKRTEYTLKQILEVDLYEIHSGYSNLSTRTIYITLNSVLMLANGSI